MTPAAEQRQSALRARLLDDGVAIAARGGAKIWSMRSAWMPSQCTCATDGRTECLRHKGQEALNRQMEGGDPDGFAVFGQFPYGWLTDVVRLKLLGDVARQDILHVCSGTLSEHERWTVDIRPAARPSVVAKGQQLPFLDASFRAVLIDPPYTEEYARNLYRSEFPRPSHLLNEAARVVVPGGRIGLLHIAVPITPKGCQFVTSFGVVPGPGFRIRAFTIYQRDQAALFREEDARRAARPVHTKERRRSCARGQHSTIPSTGSTASSNER